MSTIAKKRGLVPVVEFVKTQFGWSIRFREPSGKDASRPPSLAEARKAFEEAKRQAALVGAKS